MGGKHAMGDMSMRITAEVLRNRELTSALKRLTAYAATCQGENTEVWLRLLCDELNNSCRALGYEDRFAYRDTLGVDWIERIPG